ncbi:hypothetical protein L1887_03732 [Cichorium endivia]|nr:hypothetical protein L1887_03732 [Cichorium endivia]
MFTSVKEKSFGILILAVQVDSLDIQGTVLRTKDDAINHFHLNIQLKLNKFLFLCIFKPHPLSSIPRSRIRGVLFTQAQGASRSQPNRSIRKEIHCSSIALSSSCCFGSLTRILGFRS